MPVEPIDTQRAKQLARDDLFRRLDCGAGGLSGSEAARRLRQIGPNEIAEKKRGWLSRFLGYFWGPIPWMIEVAAALSAAVSHWSDFTLISALLMLNASVGFWQERKAGNAIELLKRKLALRARALRDGGWLSLPARELVPGDVIRIRLGDVVPADGRLVDGDYLLADESALTGESLPAEKHCDEIVYSGSVIRRGEMDCLVTATGMDTFFGHAAALVEEARTRSHFQRAVIKISDYLIVVAGIMVTIIFVAALFRHASAVETMRFVLVLTVASIPVALPAVLSVTMAVGAVALARKEAIVSRLASIEEMAGMDILCSDKTGTITKNELTLAEVRPLDGFSPEEVLKLGELASRAEDGDPIDDAILSVPGRRPSGQIIAFHPFDPVTKRSEALVEAGDGGRFRVTKGAPQVILGLADGFDLGKEVRKEVDGMAARGYRALGVARAEGESGPWRFAGLIPLYDPPREDSAETIRAAQSLGVNIKMLTGDHVAIAREIADEVGLGTDIKPVTAFLDRPERESCSAVEAADGFAQVFPEHKYRIVELLQNGNHIVGMTGDGVNDAPALKKADAGIAVAGATDAAKTAADIVFTKPGLSVIIEALKQSRRIFERMNSYAIYRIAETSRVLLFMTLSILIFNFYPITPVMIVLLALLNDAPIMTIAYDRTRLARRPARWDMGKVLSVATVLGLMGVLASFGIFYLGLVVFGLNRGTIQTLIFLKLMVAGHLTIYLARTAERPFWTRPLPAPILIMATETTQLIATVFAVYGVFMSPIGWRLAVFVWAYALVTAFLVNDPVKVWFYRALNLGARLRRKWTVGPQNPPDFKPGPV